MNFLSAFAGGGTTHGPKMDVLRTGFKQCEGCKILELGLPFKVQGLTESYIPTGFQIITVFGFISALGVGGGAESANAADRGEVVACDIFCVGEGLLHSRR